MHKTLGAYSILACLNPLRLWECDRPVNVAATQA
jgi:hypothetical protein